MSKLSSVLGGVVLAGALQAATPTQAADVPPMKTEIVDMHTVLVIDVSSSVDEAERALMMEGYSRALKSPESQSQFNSGLRYGMSVVFFGSTAQHTVTAVIRNAEDAASFADEVFFDSQNNLPRSSPSLGSSTNIAAAYDTAARLFDSEQAYGIQSITRSVVIAGDGEQSGMQDGETYVAALTQNIGQNHNAVVYGIPIVSAAEAMSPQPLPKTLSAWYANAIATPKGLRYTGEGQNVPLRQGVSIPSAGFDGVQRAVETALKLNMF